MIITQELKNMANKFLKEAFLTSLSILVNPVISELIESCTNLEETMIMLKIHDAIAQVAIRAFEIAIPEIDEWFSNSEYRKTYFFRGSKQHKNRILLFGELSYDRTYYTDKSKKNGFYLIDELFNFEKGTTYSPEVRGLVIAHSSETNSNLTSKNTSLVLGKYIAYISQNRFSTIPRQTIYNWIKDWTIPKIEYPCIEKTKNLYVMVDEKWIHEQIRLALLDEKAREKRHYIMSKCFVTFTGAKTKHGRTTLLNRHVFMTSSNKPWVDFTDEIYKIYNFEEIENIYLLSDAGSWILAGKSELKLFKNNKVIVNICEFHVKEYINRLTRSKDNRAALVSTIYEKPNKKKFIKLADEIIEVAKNKDKKTQYKNYVLNHWKGIQNMREREIKSSMESHISHCVANVFGSRPKGYSKTRLENYLKLEEAKLNNINIMDLYLKSFGRSKDEYIYNKKEVSYSVFDRDTSILPVRASSSPLSQLFSALAFPC